MREIWWPFPQQAFAKAWFLPCFTVCAHQPSTVAQENYAVGGQLQKYFRWTSQQWNCNLMFTSFPCLRTSIWRRNGRWQKKFASVWIIRNFDRGSLLFLQARGDEIMKHRHGTHLDDVSDLSISRQVSDFWHSAILKFFTLGDLEKVLHNASPNLILSGQQQGLQLSFTSLPISSFDRLCLEFAAIEQRAHAAAHMIVLFW